MLDVVHDGLDDDDRVVHDDADGEHEAEERQGVQREAEAEHHCKCADQGHRHRDQRDDRRAPRLQEDHHDDDDQEDGFEQGVGDGVYRLADEDGRVVDDAIVHAGRKVLLQALHRGVDVVRGLERVGAGTLEYADRDRRLVVEEAAQRVAARSELEPGDVRQVGNLPIVGRADDDVAELGLGGQPPLRVDRELEGGGGRRRRRAEDAGGDLDVLLADRAHDVAGRQLPRGEPIRIQPDPHAVFTGAEHLDGADTRQPRDLVLHLQVRVVRQVEHVVALVGRDQVHHHDEVW